MTARDLYYWHNPQICATCRLCEYIADEQVHICMNTLQPVQLKEPGCPAYKPLIPHPHQQKNKNDESN